MLETGDPIDIWVVDRPLGRGGMGSVYRCHNRNAPRILAAVKVLEPSLARRGDTQARFIREAEILFQLEHPNIVKVRNVRVDHDPPYLEMEFVEGDSLEDVLERGPLPLDRAIPLMVQAARALDYLHQRGVRHRDIKPANFLVRKDRRLKLVDFGLAMEADVSRITQQGMAFGTVSYAPPEWITPENLDPRSWDIYALGVVFWEMLTGEVAFPVSGQGSGRQQVMQVIVGKQGHAPLDPGDAIPEPIRELVRQMTHSTPAERLRTAADAVKALEGLDGYASIPPLLAEPTEEHSVVVSAPTPGVPLPRASAPDATWTDTEPVTTGGPPPGWRRVAAFVGVGGIVSFGLAALVGLGAIGWYTLGGAGRPVDVALVGIPNDVPVDAGIIGHTPTSFANHTLRFASLPAGAHEVRWAVGAGCTVAACASDDCPAWCGEGAGRVHVDFGAGKQVATIDAQAPRPRTVRIPLPDLPREVTIDARLGSTVANRSVDGLGFPDVLPGEYPLSVTIGACTAADRGCAPTGCPAGCRDLRATLTVPWDTGPLPAGAIPDLGLAAFVAEANPTVAPVEPAPPAPPSPAPAVQVPAPGTAAAAPTPKPAPSGDTRWIRTGKLAEWLANNPGYQPGGPQAPKTPDYLSGWTGAEPPPGAAPNKVVIGLSWHAARKYCGRLPDASAPRVPGMDEYFEWREENGKPVAVDEANTRIPTVGTDESILFNVVARCAP